MQCELAGVLSHGGFEQNRRVYKTGGLCPTIITAQGSRVKIIDERPTVRVTEATKKGYAEAMAGDSINLAYPGSKTRRGRVGRGVAQTLTCVQSQAVVTPERGAPRIRKLTPKECWRLMGFDDEDFEKARAVCSDTQLYKQAGNSIVVNVLEGILGSLLLGDASAGKKAEV